MSLDLEQLEQTLTTARETLLSCRVPSGNGRSALGHWQGELSSSALSTATASFALELFAGTPAGKESSGEVDLSDLAHRGRAWLIKHQNEDGGWGDTVDSPSNISTTALCWAAFALKGQSGPADPSAAQRAEAWLQRAAGGLAPAKLAAAINAVYGNDRTFSVPILTMCALAGRLGKGREAWQHVPALPFELAALPHTWFPRLGLPVVSYALPALIAIGQVRHFHRPISNPVTRCLRNLARERTLSVLRTIQPRSGGFLEAAPLTSFVTMSLVSIGVANHPVVEKAVRFLIASVRKDGSWPIDTNLATWVTTLSINALASGDNNETYLSLDERAAIRTWLVRQQYREEHPYTHAAPGGWAWTDLSGGVPDADDTSGALLALRQLTHNGEVDTELRPGVANGVKWLLDLQNRDGGIPTFCRGWGKLPFDRSCPDLTAHALRAWSQWQASVPDELRRRIHDASAKAIGYLINAQRRDGSWVPLWFGNQEAPNQENPLYGTTRVLRATVLSASDRPTRDAWHHSNDLAVQWLLSAQKADGGWGGAPSIASSIEETAMAVEALTDNVEAGGRRVLPAIERGCTWLIERTRAGTHFPPAPIGLYFAKLWYSERLYPVIFSVAAFERVRMLYATAGRNGAGAKEQRISIS